FTKEQWLERIANRYNAIAVEDGKAVGTMGAYISNDEVGEIANIVGVFVTSKARGQGLGSKLFDFVLAKVKEDHKLSKITLTVNNEQLYAVGLYEKLGFKTVGEETTLMGDGKEHIELLMERRV
ncbi:MAG: GCN5-related N-acetyltransferase, partial [candidate division WWE3 bacterium GW2011_GWC1_42_102]